MALAQMDKLVKKLMSNSVVSTIKDEEFPHIKSICVTQAKVILTFYNKSNLVELLAITV